MLKVIIADDQDLLRESLKIVLDINEDIQVDELGVRELSKTERNIAKLVGRGFSNKEIAQYMKLSEGTVRNSLSTALSKLDLRDRTQLAIWTVQINMVQEELE